MADQAKKGRGIPRGKVVLSGDIRTVSFKEGYLDNLVEAEALLEVVGKMVSHYDDIQMNPKAFMGISILLENITQLIALDANLVNDSDTASNTPMKHEAMN